MQSLASAGTTESRTRRYARKREAILEAAIRAFNARGIRGTSLTDVASSVGLMTNSITYYYRRKEDLAAACVLRTIAWYELLLNTAAALPHPAERLRNFLHLYLRDLAAIEAGRAPPQMRLRDLRALPSPQSEPVFAAYNDFFRRARALFFPQGCVGGLTRDARNARTHLALSVVHTLNIWIDRYEPADYPRVGTRVADILLAGLAGSRSRWPQQEAGQAAALHAPPSASTEAFLRAATALINEQGYRGASIDKIAARLRVTKGAFYHHNDNKDELVANCLVRTLAIIRTEQDAADARGGCGWEQLTGCVRALVRHQFSETGPLLRCSAAAAMPDGPHGSTGLMMRRIWERMAFPISDGIADGSVRALDASIAAQVVSSAVDAACDLDRWVPKVDADSAVDLFARPLFVGVYAP